MHLEMAERGPHSTGYGITVRWGSAEEMTEIMLTVEAWKAKFPNHHALSANRLHPPYLPEPGPVGWLCLPNDQWEPGTRPPNEELPKAARVSQSGQTSGRDLRPVCGSDAPA